MSSLANRRGRILIVDDEPMMLELISTRLELAGYQTFVARLLRGARPAAGARQDKMAS